MEERKGGSYYVRHYLYYNSCWLVKGEYGRNPASALAKAGSCSCLALVPGQIGGVVL